MAGRKLALRTLARELIASITDIIWDFFGELHLRHRYPGMGRVFGVLHKGEEP